LFDFGDTISGKDSLSGLTLYANATFNFSLKKEEDKIFSPFKKFF
jgi:hypothetical protein